MSIALREWREEDVEEIVRLTNAFEITRWTRIPSPNTPELVREWMSTWADGELHLCIADPGTDEVIGSIALMRGDAENRRAEIGYWVSGERRNQGVATAAVDLLTARAFDEGWERLELHIDPENAVSRRVAEKAGYAFEGVLRSYDVIKDRRVDVAMYARIASAPHG